MKSAALKSAIAIIWPPVLQIVKIMNGRNQIKKIQHKASGFVLSYLTLEKLSRDKKKHPLSSQATNNQCVGHGSVPPNALRL